MLVLDFKELKNTQRRFYGMYVMSQQGSIEVKGEYEDFYISPGRDTQITACGKLLNIKYKFHGFSGDLIANEYVNVVRLLW